MLMLETERLEDDGWTYIKGWKNYQRLLDTAVV
jgi:hypothetical protein